MHVCRHKWLSKKICSKFAFKLFYAQQKWIKNFSRYKNITRTILDAELVLLNLVKIAGEIYSQKLATTVGIMITTRITKSIKNTQHSEKAFKLDNCKSVFAGKQKMMSGQ